MSFIVDRGLFMSKTDKTIVIRDGEPVVTQSGSSSIPNQPTTEPALLKLQSISFSSSSPFSPFSSSEGSNTKCKEEPPRGPRKFIALDDNDQVIVIRNEKKDPKVVKIQIFCEGDIELISNQKIKFCAKDNIEFITKKKIKFFSEDNTEIKTNKELAAEANGTQFVVRRTHVGTNKEYRTLKLIETPTRAILEDPPEQPEEKNIKKIAPKKFDCERGCAPNKKNAGPISPKIISGGGGGGGGGGSSPAGSSPAPSSFSLIPVPFIPDTPPQEPFGALCYGT